MYQPSVLPTRNIYHCLNFILVYLGCSVRVGWWWVAGVWSIQHSPGLCCTMWYVVHSPPIIGHYGTWWYTVSHLEWNCIHSLILTSLKHMFHVKAVKAPRPRINMVSLKKVSSWICAVVCVVVKGFSESIFFKVLNWCRDFYEPWMTLRVLLSPQHTGPITIKTITITIVYPTLYNCYSCPIQSKNQ